MLIRNGLALALLASLVVIILLSSARNAHYVPLNLNGQPAIFRVQQGDGVIRVLKTLETEGIIDSVFKIRVGLLLNDKDHVLKRGVYQVSGETVLQLLDRMDRSDVIAIQLIQKVLPFVGLAASSTPR